MSSLVSPLSFLNIGELIDLHIQGLLILLDALHALNQTLTVLFVLVDAVHHCIDE